MNYVIWLNLFSILNICVMAMEYNGGVRNIKIYNNIFEHTFKKIRNFTIRFMVRHHYSLLKNEYIKNKINKLVSNYYDSVYHYYKLTDEEREFMEMVIQLFI